MAARRAPVEFPNGVRLSFPTSSRPYFRVRIPDATAPQGYREESAGRDEGAARAKAQGADSRLATRGGAARAKRLDRPFADLLDAYLDIDAHADWSPGHHYEISGLVRKWVRPVMGHVVCGDVTAETYEAVFAQMRKAGARGSIDRTRRTLSACHRWGRSRGWIEGEFDVSKAQAMGPQQRTAGTQAEFISKDQRPDLARVDRLVDALETIGYGGGTWWRGLQGQVAAWPGLRLGETFALRSCHIDDDLLSVRWQYIEWRGTLTPEQQEQADAAPDDLLWMSETEAYWPQAPGILMKPPKSEKTRVALAPPWLVERLAKRVAEVEGQPAPPCPDCSDAGCSLLFPAPNGGPHRRSLFGRDVARKAYERTQKDDNPDLRWPKKRTGGWQWRWHHLRHRSAVHHLDTLRLPVSDAATLLGHTEETLMARYYGSTGGVLERARAAYTAAPSGSAGVGRGWRR